MYHGRDNLPHIERTRGDKENAEKPYDNDADGEIPSY